MSQPDTILRNFASDRYYYIGDNRIVRHLIRTLGNPLGSQAFGILSMFKSFCKNSDGTVIVHASQGDWADYLGIGKGCFQRATQALEEIGLIKIKRPEGYKLLKGYTLEYIMLEPDMDSMFSIEEIEDNPIARFDNSLAIEKREELKQRYEEKRRKNREAALSNVDVQAIIKDGDATPVAEELVSIVYTRNNITVPYEEEPVVEKPPAAPPKKKPRKSTKDKVLHYMSRAEYLAEIIEKYIKVNKKSKIIDWANSIRLLHKRDKVQLRRIDDVLAWYDENIGEEFVPQAYSGSAFREKFPNLEQAMARDSKFTPGKKNANKFEKIAPVFRKPDIVLDNSDT